MCLVDYFIINDGSINNINHMGVSLFVSGIGDLIGG